MANSIGDMIVRIVGDNKSLDDAMTKSERKMKDFGELTAKVGKNLTKFVTLPILGIGAASLKTAGDFEASMNKVKAISGATQEEFIELEKLARQMGATTQFSASQAADAMSFLAMAGFDATKIMESLPSVLNLAAASGIDLASSADIVTNVMSGFNLTSEQLAKTVDVLTKQFTSSNTDLTQLGQAFKYVGPVAQGFGLTIEETAAAVGILSDAGLQASVAGTGLRRILSELSKKSEDLGITVFDAAGKMLPLADIIEQLEERGLSAGEALEIFGDRGGPSMQVLLSRGSEALREMVDNLSDVDGLAQTIAETRMQGLNGQLKILKSVAEEAAISIGEQLIPPTIKLLEAIGKLVSDFIDLDTNTKKTIITLAGIAAAIGPITLGVGKLVVFIPQVTAALRVMNLTLATTAPWIAAATAAVALGAAIFALTKNVRQERKEREELQKKVVEGTALSIEERLRLVELEIARLRDVRAMRLRALETAKSLNQSRASLDLLQENIDAVQNEINLQVAYARGIKLETILKAENSLETDGLTDSTEGLTFELEQNTGGFETNTESIEDNTEAIEYRGETFMDMVGEEVRLLAVLANARKQEHEEEIARIEKEKQARIDASKFAYNQVKDISGAYFDYKKSLYDEDSKEYKELLLREFNLNKAFSAIDTTISGLSAAVRAFKDLGPVAGGIAAAVIGALTATNVALILAKQPPAFAQGGIVMPTPGGTIARVAEAGQPEVIFPLDRLDDMLGGIGEGNIHLTVNLDSRPILESIFPATRNRLVLIDAGAVV